MLKKMSVILCGVILSCCISVFASTEEKESVGVVSDNNLEEISIFLDRAADVPGGAMDKYEDEETKEVEPGNVSGDEISGRQEDVLDEITSANEIHNGTDEIISENEILEGTDDTVSVNEVLEETDEIVSVDEMPQENKTEENMEEGEETVSGADIDQGSENRDKDETVVKVSFPEKIRIGLDPKNLLGKGSIYSDEYKIINYGNSDVVVRVKTTDVFYKNKEDAQEGPNAEALDVKEGPDVKDLDVRIVWDKEKNVKRSVDAETGDDVYYLHLKASQYDEKNEFVKLGDGSEMSFRFTGEINGDPDVQWNIDDLGFQFSYKIEKAEDTEGQGKVEGLAGNEELSENENEQYRLE